MTIFVVQTKLLFIEEHFTHR